MPDLEDLHESLTVVREDVAFIKAKVEAIPDHEQRIRFLERWKWGLPATLITSITVAVAAFLNSQ